MGTSTSERSCPRSHSWKAEGGQQGPTRLGQGWNMRYEQQVGRLAGPWGLRARPELGEVSPGPLRLNRCGNPRHRVRAAPVGGSVWATAKDQVGRGRSPKLVPKALAGMSKHEGTLPGARPASGNKSKNLSSQARQEERGRQARAGPAAWVPQPPPALPQAEGLSSSLSAAPTPAGQ